MTLNPSIATFVSLVAAVACFGDLSHADEPPTGTGKEPPIEAAGRLRIAIDPVRPWYYARIEGVDPGAAIRVVPARTMPVAASLSEGYYLSVLHESEAPALDRPRLLRVLVTDVGTNGKAVLQVAPSIAAMLKPGTFLTLVRPATATTARLRQFPDSVVQAEGSVPWPQSAAELQVCRSESLTHLRQIGLALHSFHATFNRFPPAIVVGPDGKPWHSWRVLLLPYLDERALYEEYKWDEPWDGPNNRRLIEARRRCDSRKTAEIAEARDLRVSLSDREGEHRIVPSSGWCRAVDSR